MRNRIHGALEPVRRRQLGLLLMRSAGWGLIAGSVGGVYLGVVRLLGRPVSPVPAVLFLVVVPALAVVIGALRGRSYRGAAAAIDSHYRLKDRSTTALDFVAKVEPTALHSLQIEDAQAHLDRIKPSEVAPLRVPRTLAYAASLLLVAVTLLLWPVAPGKSAKAAPAPPLASIVAEAEKIVEDLKQIDELARSERNTELEKLVKELVEKAEEMKQPGVDLKEALAKLSEMQAAIAAEQAKYNVGLVDGQLQSLGAAMQADPGDRRRRPGAPGWQVRPGRQGVREARHPAGRQERDPVPRREAQGSRQVRWATLASAR